MDGDPARYRHDGPGPELDSDPDYDPAPQRRRFLFPILTFSVLFGLAAAIAAVINSNVIGADVDALTEDGGNWKVSALLIATVSSAWFAGAAYLTILSFQPTSNKPRMLTGLPLSLAAFAMGPLLIVLFLFGLELAHGPVNRLVIFAAIGAVILVVIFGQRRFRQLAERMLVAFFIWIAILIVPTFWRDPVNLQMSEFLFGLLNAAGLMN